MSACSLETVERDKYARVWSLPAYRRVSPGELSVDDFTGWASDGSVLDLGCGTGRAGLKLSRNHPVTMVDISPNCLDEDVRAQLNGNLRFERQCLWDLDVPPHDYGFCCDVMEHIPEEKVDAVLKRIAQTCRSTYFRIYLHPDNGKFIDEPLHLTVQNEDWWFERIYRHYDGIRMKGNRTVATYFARHI